MVYNQTPKELTTAQCIGCGRSIIVETGARSPICEPCNAKRYMKRDYD